MYKGRERECDLGEILLKGKSSADTSWADNEMEKRDVRSAARRDVLICTSLNTFRTEKMAGCK